MINKSSLVFLLSMFLSGCATIVSPWKYSVSISSNVGDAKVTIFDRDEEIEVVTTPAKVDLSPSAGYFSPAKYSFVFEKEGFTSDKVKLSAELNRWYIGNIFFGGLIGMLLVDPISGAMWKFEDTTVTGSLKSLEPPKKQIELYQHNTLLNQPIQLGVPSVTSESVEINQIPL